MEKATSRHGITALLILAAAALLASACYQHNRTPFDGTSEDVELDATTGSRREQQARVEELMADASGHDPDKALRLVDSLEQQGMLTRLDADFHRAMCCLMANRLRLAEYYFRVVSSSEAVRQSRPDRYFAAKSNLAELLIEKSNYGEALSLAARMAEELEHESDAIRNEFGPAAMCSIGSCELQLGRRDEGMHTMRRALDDAKTRAMRHGTTEDVWQWAVAAVNIAMAIRNASPDKSVGEQWVMAADEAVQALEDRHGVARWSRDMLVGQASALRAIWLAQHGRLDEASEAFRRHSATHYSTTDAARHEQLDYFTASGQSEMAVKLIEQVISLHSSPEERHTIQYLCLLADAIRLYRETGQTDNVIRMAQQMEQLVDSVRQQQQRDNAQELAVVYETQQKEEEIVRQQWRLRRTQGATVAVVLGLLVVFLAVYILLRRHNERCLQVANDKLARRNEELAETTARAEEASRMKTNFIRQVNHEIRTPLNHIVGFTQIVTDLAIEVTEEELADINRRIMDSANLITRIVDKTLEMSETISRQHIVRHDRMTAEQLADMAVDMSGIRKAPHLDMTVSIGTEARQTELLTSKHYAVRALTVLLENAEKFTRHSDNSGDTAGLHATTPDGPREQVRLHVETDGQWAVFAVEDTGCGVPPREAERIFQEFVKLDEFRTGMGVGLPLARLIARQLGGDVRLDTNYRGGARFVMTLPVSE